jgi:hypothetical protein
MLKDFYEKPSNQYIHQNIEDSRKTLVTALGKLSDIIYHDFDAWPYHQKAENYTACLSPMNNIDRDGRIDTADVEKYDQLARKLNQIVDSVEITYTSVRRAVKVTLHI